jgi:hypothetical protein
MTISQMRELERQATVIEEAKKMSSELPVEYPQVDRFEVIDHTSKARGRVVVEYGVKVEVSIQDGGKTMKIFLTNRKK